MASDKKIKGRKIKKEEMFNKKKENMMTNVGVNEENRSSNPGSKKVKMRKIRMSLTNLEEKKMDKAIEQEDKMSIAVMAFILFVCFIVGISLGYLLYRIAINGAI